jgi:hypothetical protein
VTLASKEAERAELHKIIWRIANDLRGSVDGWDFKSYVLGMLFYRFISENLTAYLNEQERAAGYPDFDYTTLWRWTMTSRGEVFGVPPCQKFLCTRFGSGPAFPSSRRHRPSYATGHRAGRNPASSCL